jgi:uracil-DNA glycosylase
LSWPGDEGRRIARPAALASPTGSRAGFEFDRLIERVRGCTLCRDAPRYGAALPHEPRPVFQATPSARICIVGQAPGARAHLSGRPFTDPSGVRLRAWLGLAEPAFYDARAIAIIPMGFCFPGNDADGADLPPRRECAETWHALVLKHLPDIELTLLIGRYAQKWRLDPTVTTGGVASVVRRWREIYDDGGQRRIMPLPHPSWRNSGWIKRNPWFETELLPVLRNDIATLLASFDPDAGSPRSRNP